MIPFYTAEIDNDTEGMDYMGLVDYPAHQKSWVSLNEKQERPVKYTFNEDKMEVTGVGIASMLPIYRNDEIYGEHFLVFKPKDIKQIVEKMMASGYQNNVNEMHDLNRDLKGVTFLEGWFWDSKREKTDNLFSGQNIKDGSWMVTYKVNDPEVWKRIKRDEWAGFSIEGWFKKVPLAINGQFIRKPKQSKSKNLKMKKKGIFMSMLFGAETFGTATTTDGIVISWEGDLAEGVEITITDEAGEMVLAPEGEHSIENEDGTITILTIDANGMVSAIETVTPDAEEEDEEMGAEEDDFNAEVVANAIKRVQTELRNDFDKSLAEIKSEYNAKFEAMAVELDKAFESDSKKKFVRKSKKSWKDYSK